jgi:acetyl esterase/lipase
MSAESTSREVLSREPVPSDARLSYGERPSQFVDFWDPAGGRATALMVMIHGGFWRHKYDLTHASHLCARLASLEFAVASLEYSRVGEADNTPQRTLEDVRAGAAEAHRVARERYGLQIPVWLMGHSAGGYLALMLATDESKTAGAIALAPVACLDLAAAQNLGNGAVAEFVRGETTDDLCPSRRPSQIPRLIIHGGRDDVVPVELSREFVRRRQGDSGRIELVELDEADHFHVIDPQSAPWFRVEQAIMRTAGPARA